MVVLKGTRDWGSDLSTAPGYLLIGPGCILFAAVYVGTRAKLEFLALHFLKAAKRIFGIPDFRYYALADGIKEVLSKAGKGKVLLMKNV
ncbi:MAG: hypothetical protein JSV40_07855 [Deltaproteobacteria bacterium]|nr:MAG: hypothetical protein JSV40_07855 [Deltaproteobacteria bacterium]